MKKFVRPLIPGFLKKYDKKLLLNHPDTWATRWHLVLWYAFLFLILCFAFALLTTFEPRRFNNISTGVSFISLISFVGFIIWMIYLLRFNVFKQYGNQKPFTGLKNLVLFFISCFAIILPTYVLPILESIIANKKFTSTELVTDVNFMNEQLVKKYHNYLPKNYTADTIHLTGRNGMEPADAEVKVAPVVVNTAEPASDYFIPQGPNNIYLDSISFIERKKSSDSLVNLSDSSYVSFTAPSLQFISAGNAQDYTSVKPLTNIELFKKYLLNRPTSNTIADTVALRNRVNKYLYQEWPAYYPPLEKGMNYYEMINRDYSISAVQQNLDNITRKKYRWDLEKGFYIRMISYLSLILALLIFIYRHSTRKVFFLSILTVIILAVLTGIFLSAVKPYKEEGVLLSIMIGYYAVFMAIALSIYSAGKRKTWQGIGLNLATFFTFLLPTMILHAYFSFQRPLFIEYPGPAYVQNYAQQDLFSIYAEIAGFILIVILIEPLFKRLYRKWYALPED